MTTLAMHETHGAHPGTVRREGTTDWARLLIAVVARAVLLSVVSAAAWMAVPSLWGWKATTVMSDSMAPGIRAGDVVVSMPQGASTITAGRIVLVDDPDHAGRLRLHRLIDRTDDGRLVLKGDANPQQDSSTIAVRHVFGVAVMRTPYLGLPLVWASRGQYGLVVAAIAGLAALALIGASDAHLRRRRVEAGRMRERLRRRGTMALAAGVAAALVAVVGATGAHAALSSMTKAGPANGTGTSFAASSSIGCFSPSPTDSPFLYWALNSASGTSALDAAGNGRTGTLGTGVTLAPGTCSSSPYVSVAGATTATIASATSLTAPTTFSLEAWVRTTSTTGGRIVGFGTSSTGASTTTDRQLFLAPNGKAVFGYTATTAQTIASNAAINDGQWHHVVATMEGGIIGLLGGGRLYVDGVAQTATTSVAPSTLPSGYWRGGYDAVSGYGTLTPTTASLTGSIDDIAVYTTALSAARVSAHFTAGRL